MRKRESKSMIDIISIVANNVMPVAGVVFLRWGAAPVLFLYWLDGELSIMELMASVIVELNREEKNFLPSKVKGIRKAVYLALTFLLAGFFASIPAFIAGGVLYGILDKYLSNPLDAMFGQVTIWYGIAINVLARGYNAIQAASKKEREDIKFTAEEKYHILAYRCVIMFLLGGFLFDFARGWVLTLFVVLVAGLFAYSELYPERLLHIAGFYKAKEIEKIKEERQEGTEK